jgi:hypothetical protein
MSLSSTLQWTPRKIFLSLLHWLRRSEFNSNRLSIFHLTRYRSKFVYELHLRSIRTNQPHPRAPVSILPCLLKPSTHALSSDVVAAVRVQVSGNLVALLIKEVLESTGAHLEIWNWENSPQFSVGCYPDLISLFRNSLYSSVLWQGYLALTTLRF